LPLLRQSLPSLCIAAYYGVGSREQPKLQGSHFETHRFKMQKSKEDIMAKLASIELNAAQDVAKRNKTRIISLFSNADLWQEFQLLENVQRGKTGIKVTIAKVGSFRTKADTAKRKGEKTSCSLLLKHDGFTRKIAAIDDIKKGDKLTVTLETL
jgi:hypothetical protein